MALDGVRGYIDGTWLCFVYIAISRVRVYIEVMWLY